jgi:hypothetical protein
VNLEDRLESGLPSAWRPDQDDPPLLIGKVIEVEVGQSDYGRYPIIVVRLDDGSEKAVHGFHSVLQNELQKTRPNIGERIGIKYLGDVETKPGSRYKSYKGYRVKVERESGAFDWAKLDQASDDLSGHVIYEQVQDEPVTVPAGAGDDDVPF